MNTDAFLELLSKSGLATEDQIDDALALVDSATSRQLEDAEFVGQSFIKQGLITPWHLRQLLKRRYKGFFIRQYKILGILGAGGMSTVYLGEHTLMHRQVAIKVLPKERLKKGTYLDHFVREAQMIAALDHPNIIRAYDIDREDDLQYIVMEFFDGINLQKMVETQGPLSVPDIVDYMRQTAEALAYAHKAGIVHRDVKPGNILVDAKNHVKLLDLGLAMIDQKLYSGRMTSSIHESSILGTADYLAPEQAINSQKIDARADIYALGCVLYFCLTGHPPFPTGSVPERLLAHQQKEPTSILKDRPNTAPDLVAICAKMMAKNPKNRQQTASEVARDLTNWLVKHGFRKAATPPSGSHPAPGTKKDPVKQFPTQASEETTTDAPETDSDVAQEQNRPDLRKSQENQVKEPSRKFLPPGSQSGGTALPGSKLPPLLPPSKKPGEGQGQTKPSTVLLPPGLQGGTATSPLPKTPKLPPLKPPTKLPTKPPVPVKQTPQPEQEKQEKKQGSDIRIGEDSSEKIYGMKTDVDLTTHEEVPLDDSFIGPDALGDLAGKTSIDLESTLHLQSTHISPKKQPKPKQPEKEKPEKEKSKAPPMPPKSVAQGSRPLTQQKTEKSQKPGPVQQKTTTKPVEKPVAEKPKAVSPGGKTGVQPKASPQKPTAPEKIPEKAAPKPQPQPQAQKPQPQQKAPPQQTVSQIKIDNSAPLSSAMSRSSTLSTGTLTQTLGPTEQIVIQPPKQTGRVLSTEGETAKKPVETPRPEPFPLAEETSETGIFAIAGEKTPPPAATATAVKPAPAKTTKGKTGKKPATPAKPVAKKKQFDDESFDQMLSNYANSAIPIQSVDENDEAVLQAIEELNKLEEERIKLEEAEAAHKKIGIIEGLTLKPALKKELEMEVKHGPLAAPREEIKPSWFELVPVWFWSVFGLLIAAVILFGFIIVVR